MKTGIIFEKKNSCYNPRMAIWIERESERSPAERTKNGGPQWLPVQAGKTTTGHSTHAAQGFRRNKSHKIYALTPAYSETQNKERICAIIKSLEGFKVHQSWETSPIESPARLNALPFPRFIRHLKLLPSSESLAFDWRSLHLPRTQVMHPSPTPFILK